MTDQPDALHKVAPLFADHRRRRHLIDHGLENGVASAVVDDEDEPRVAALRIGQVTVLGGDPQHPAAARIVADLARTVVQPETDGWQALVCRIHGDGVKMRRRTTFDAAGLDLEHIDALAASGPATLELRRLDRVLAERLGAEVGGGFFGKFASLEQFLAIGFGYAGIVEGRIAAGASTGAVCRRGISIQIETHPDFRRRGIGVAVGATLIAHCLRAGIDPHWSAATAVSAQLAEKLGYTATDAFDELILSR